ncbi:TldD/PmbA family protein [Heliophilum fasciatum]|uniref:TldD protein n=1 Tax=Heliophilum fasciatum TaxID=35700 RepID=A0A4R2RUS2_9FIRM|nr:TldD/PmbA family protein [Heliophilum fasciatum]MCW2277316.1 TldD protein [Heliophilum fasciatum]TCP67153.1 TldD protein [Heliophilum fasciatum]
MEWLDRPGKEALQNVLQVAMQHGGDFADIFVEKKVSQGIGCEDDKIERLSSGVDVGAGIRVIAGEATAYAYTNDLTVEGLTQAAQVASHAAQGGAQGQVVDLRPALSPVDLTVELPPDQVTVDDKVAHVLRANQQARSMDERIKQVSVMYADVVQAVTVANSEGVYMEDERVRSRFVVHAVAAGDSGIQTGYESLGGTVGFELFREKEPEAVAQAAVNRALLLLSAQPAPTGKMPVVMAGSAGGTMVHEACGHGLEADLVQKGLSVYGGKLGQSVASPLVTVIDDGTLAGKYGALRFDDEGTPGQRTVLIEEGELKGYMYDRFTAAKEKRASTGNGRRESYQHKPIPRMTNTIIAPGKEDPTAIIKDTPRGLLVTRMGGGQVNTTTGDFVFDVAEGYLIEKGEVTHAVRGATLTGNGPEALKVVDRVGSDLGFAIGTCGKDGQGVPVADAQPTMRMKSLIVGGTGAAEPSGPQIRRIEAMPWNEDVDGGYGRIRRR